MVRTLANRRREALLVSLVSIAVVLSACKGEDRPDVDVIGGNGKASASVSASGEPAPAPAANAASGGPRYNVATNVDSYFAMALDLRDIRAVIDPAAQGQPVDWSKALAVYDGGKNQVLATGALRSLASQPNESVQAVFPNGASVYGRANFIDALIRDGLNGTGRAQGLSDAARRQVVDKGIQMLFYGKALQEFTASKTRLETNAANPVGPVDETWAIIAGAPDNNLNRSYALLATAASRESEFKLQGKIIDPMEKAIAAAQAAAQKNDKDAFNKAYAEGKAYLNSIFYLSVLRIARSTEGDSATPQRQVHLAEGWTYWQTIRATVAGASSSAAQAIESAFTRPANQPFPASETAKVYAALNDPAVLQALGIPALLQVKTPPAQ